MLTGGVDANAFRRPKRFFGAARNIEEGGSLSIIATALIDTGSKMDEVIFEEFKGTGNSEIVLDRKVSDKRIFPALDVGKSGTRKEELLVDQGILTKMWVLPADPDAQGNDPINEMQFLLDKMEGRQVQRGLLRQHEPVRREHAAWHVQLRDIFTAAELLTLGQVILIDLTMAGDNVVIIGTLSVGLPARDRRKVISLGVGLALFPDWLRTHSDPAAQDHGIAPRRRPAAAVGRVQHGSRASAGSRRHRDDPLTPAVEGPATSKTFLQAAVQVTIALDLSMSLDNVLAVAAAAASVLPCCSTVLA